MHSSVQERHQSSDSAQRSQRHAQQRRRGGRQRAHGTRVFRTDLHAEIHTSRLLLQSSEVAFFLKLFKCARRSPQAPNSSESPGTSRTEHSDLLEEEEDERSDIKVKKKKSLSHTGDAEGAGQRSLFCSVHQGFQLALSNRGFPLAHIKAGSLLALCNQGLPLARIKPGSLLALSNGGFMLNTLSYCSPV